MLERVLFAVITVTCIFNSNIHALMHLDFESNKYPFDLQLYEEVLDPELCQRQLTYLRSNTELLARFADAGIRVPRGILDGNINDFGNFHQCMAINERAEDMAVSGKYCRIRVPVDQGLGLPELLDGSPLSFDSSELNVDKNMLKQLKAVNRQKKAFKSGNPGVDMGMDMDIRIGPNSPLRNISLDLAVCIPRPCSTQQAINGLLFNPANTTFDFSDLSCRLPDDRPWVAADYVATVVFSIIGFFTLVSTCYDLYQSIYLKKGIKEISSTYTSFSAYTNARRLLTFNSSPGSLECLDGIRALAMIWVILGHSFHTVSVTVNPIETLQWSISAQGAWVTVAPLTVDTFFFLSGLLLVYTTIGKLGRMQLLKNLHIFYLNRLLRMFPILAAVILFESSFYLRVSDGPLWRNVANQAFRCREFWWSTLFHVQNFVNPREACIGVTWYLAIDVQLHILSPIVLFWVLSSKRAAWAAINTSLVLTLTASTIFIFFGNFPSGIISPNREEDMADFYIYYYVNILTRASPFIIGMVYGYLIHLWRKNDMKVPMMVTIVLLLCSLFTLLVVMYCAHMAMRWDWDNQLADNFFNSFLRPIWSLALGWIIFACVDGKAGPINWVLSLRMWKLPARISYAMYLIHYSIMVAFNASIVAPIYFTVRSTLFTFMAYLSLTMILSFFVTMLIDLPFSTIFKLLLGGGSKKTHTTEIKIHENDPSKVNNGRGNYSFAAEENEKKHRASKIEAQNDHIKLNVNEK